MFTGIIEETGKIRTITKGTGPVRLTVEACKVLEDLKIGDSINTNGICLTVVSFNKDSFSADVLPETVRRTNLAHLDQGSKVNLERALKLSDRLGGHIVSGHVDGTGSVKKHWKESNAVWLTIAAEGYLMKYIVEKGSVAIDGISLTVARADDSSFDVSVIPHTQVVTTLIERKAGDILNIECDLLAKYVEKIAGTGRNKGNITLEFLAGQGFV